MPSYCRSMPSYAALCRLILPWSIRSSPGASDPALELQIQFWSSKSSPGAVSTTEPLGALNPALERQIQLFCWNWTTDAKNNWSPALEYPIQPRGFRSSPEASNPFLELPIQPSGFRSSPGSSDPALERPIQPRDYRSIPGASDCFKILEIQQL